MFDFSNYSTKPKSYDDSNKSVIGKLKDEISSVAIEEFVRLIYLKMKCLKQFTTYRFDIVQIFFLSYFWDICLKIYIRKYLKQFSTENYTQNLDIVQNVLIPCILLISLDQNVSIIFVNNMYWEY